MPENTRQREAFDRYWGLGAERSIERLHAELREHGKAPDIRTLYAWSSQFHWQERIADLEREARQAQDEARRKAFEEMYERQAKEALLLQQKGAEWISAIAGDSVTPEAAVRAVVEGAKLERIARGEPGERIQQGGSEEYGDIDFQGFSSEELRRLVELAQRSAEGAGPPQPE